MGIKLSGLTWKSIMIMNLLLPLVAVFILSSCTCGGNGADGKDDDVNDDSDDDGDNDSDDDDTDDDAEGWYIYTIDSEDVVGEYTSIAVDSNDKVHIGYYYYGWYGSGGDLKYATNSSGSWKMFTVDSEDYVGEYTSVALDSNDKVHISYNGSIKYATNKSGAWQAYTLCAEKYSTQSSLAVDQSDKLHMSYFYCDDLDDDGCDDGGVKYTTNKSGSWQTQIVERGSDVGFSPSLALDSNGKAHICYWDIQWFAIKYATNATGGWKREEVGPAGGSDFDCDIAVDSNNKVHISYYDQYNGLKYITNSSGTWQSHSIDVILRGNYNSIALDSKGGVHIGYSDHANDVLKYVTNKTGDWRILTIDSEKGVGNWPSIAVDSEDYVHISYYDGTNQDLKYATNRPPE